MGVGVVIDDYLFIYLFLHFFIHLFFSAGVGLGLQSGARWKSTRKLLTPAFHFETVKSYTKIFQQSAEVLLVRNLQYGVKIHQ